MCERRLLLREPDDTNGYNLVHMEMLWWYWVALGMVLAIVEVVGPGGFFIIFFGAGALVVGLLSLVGVSGPLWVDWLLFSIGSVLSLLVFRKPLLTWMRRHEGVEHPVDRIEGELAIPTEDIAPGAVGRAELRGSVWSARNIGSVPLTRGQRCVVARVDGFTLSLVPEGA
jgi:membrane protein implicated in regulation of membrane protease activity